VPDCIRGADICFLSSGWSECIVLGGRPATCAPHRRGAVPRVPGPTSTARIDPTWRPSTEAESPCGTYLSANERRRGAPRSHLDAFLSARSDGPAHSPPLLSSSSFKSLEGANLSANFPSFSCLPSWFLLSRHAAEVLLMLRFIASATQHQPPALHPRRPSRS
jgi:hypothetical protein